MPFLNLVILSVVSTATVAIFVIVWLRLPEEARAPLLIYVGSYLLTYCVGGVWIGLSGGRILASYFRDQLNIPDVASFGAVYWLLLLGPVVIPACVAGVLTRKWATPVRPPGSDGPSFWQFVAVFAGLASFAIIRIFHGGYGVIDAVLSISALQGDTTTLIQRRVELFDTGTTIAFGIIYSGLPALTHAALFKANEGGKAWRVTALGTGIATVGLSLATFQIAPAVVFIAALTMSASHLQWIRMTWAKSAVSGVAFLLLLQVLNSYKFSDWTFFENAQHIIFRMPAAYLYYLDCFPASVPLLGTDWIGTVTGGGADPGAPFVVSQFMYPGSLIAGAMAAPAHVQAFAEGGVLNSVAAIATIGVLIAGVARLRRYSRNGAIWHALYIQGLVMLYYSTQASFRGVIWHSYGLLWSVLPLLLLARLPLDRPALRARQSVRVALLHNRWRTAEAARE